jgi:hypothetical protein
VATTDREWLEPLGLAVGAPFVACLLLLALVAARRGSGDGALLAEWLGCCAVGIGGEAWAFAWARRIRRRSGARGALVAAVVAASAAALLAIAAALGVVVARLAGVD